MKGTKTVTEKQLVANRRNARLSTGPRTIRGKSFSRLNAATSGLFADSVIIPAVDGYDSKEEFSKLHARLRMEFEPVGPSEEYWVSDMALNLWRRRRATRYEQGSIRKEVNWWDGKRPQDGYELSGPARDKLSMLENALKEFETTGTLSQAVYVAILPLIKYEPPRELRQQNPVQGDETNIPPEPRIDDVFLASLKHEIQLQSSVVRLLTSRGDEEVENYFAIHSLPSVRAMSQIFRADHESRKQFDWDLRQLLESQRRRKKAEAPEHN